MITVRLPWPNKILNPNARVHPYEKAPIVASHRADAKTTTLEQQLPPVAWQRVATLVIMHPPDKRHYDLDNIKASCKAYFDGIFDALKINDGTIKVAPPFMFSPIKPGFVEIYLDELSSDEWVNKFMELLAELRKIKG